MAIFASNIPENTIDIEISVVLLDIDDNNNYDIITNDITFDNYEEDFANYQPVLKVSYRKIAEDGLIFRVTKLTNNLY